MMRISPVNFNSYKSNNNVSFEKSFKQIRNAAPTDELKKIIKWAISGKTDIAIECGIPNLLHYGQRGEVQKKQVIGVLQDLIDSEDLAHEPSRRTLLNGYEGQEKEFPGYLGILKILKGNN